MGVDMGLSGIKGELKNVGPGDGRRGTGKVWSEAFRTALNTGVQNLYSDL